MKPIGIKRIQISAAEFRALPQERRSAILLLGHMLNEANWLRKLLIPAARGAGVTTPEGSAQFGLAIMLATLLASKLHEGWHRISSAAVRPILNSLPLTAHHIDLRKDVNKRLNDGTLAAIRNQLAFHYPENLDFVKLANDFTDRETTIFTTDLGYAGDLFSHISAIAALEVLISKDTHREWNHAVENVWNIITGASGSYCTYISELLALALKSWLPTLTVDSLEIGTAPNIDDIRLIFFAHPPEDIQKRDVPL